MSGLDFRIFDGAWVAIGQGTIVALLLALSAFLVGTAAGMPVGIAFAPLGKRAIPFLILNDILRAVPPLALLFIVKYGFARYWGPISPFAATAITLGLAQFAYSVDLSRSAALAISPKLKESTIVLGFTRLQRWRYALIPDHVRRVLPAQIAFLIGTLRLTSIGSIIGVGEVAWVAQGRAYTSSRLLEGWLVTAIAYAAICVPLGMLQRRLEHSRWVRRVA